MITRREGSCHCQLELQGKLCNFRFDGHKKKPYIFMQGFDLFGGSSAARTRDHRIKSAVLYRLS